MHLGKKPDVDVVRDVLEAAVAGYPDNAFVKSLLQQYDERGGLSRKQMEGLHAKALKLKTIPEHKLATLQAIILRKPQKSGKAMPENKPMFEKDLSAGLTIDAILQKFPAHKRVLFLKAKYEKNEPLSSTEIDELERFAKLLLKA